MTLTRSAASCSNANNATAPAALPALTAVDQRRLILIPMAQAKPTIMVMAISIGEKWPVRIRAQPNRNNHMQVINTSQITKQGKATHLAVQRNQCGERAISDRFRTVHKMSRRLDPRSRPSCFTGRPIRRRSGQRGTELRVPARRRRDAPDAVLY